MFYVFEGIDGSGKSTQARLLGEHLERRSGKRVLEVREPGGTALGEKVREILLDPGSGELSPEVEVFLFMAARAHLCRERIRPALEDGSIVIADRFLWSSAVYQGIVGGLGVDEVLKLGEIATRGIEPTAIFLLDLDPEIAFSRLGSRDRMEERGIEFQRRVRQGYLALAARCPERSVVLSGEGSPEEVHRLLLARMAERNPG